MKKSTFKIIKFWVYANFNILFAITFLTYFFIQILRLTFKF